MLRVVVKARKDAKAVKHALPVDAVSLSNFDPDSLEPTLFLTGRKDDGLEEVYEEVRERNPVCMLKKVNKSRVRNARLEEIREVIEMAKAELRLGLCFDGVYKFSTINGLNLEVNPDYDVYFVIGNEFIQNLKELGVEVGMGSVVLRKLYNVELYYSPKLKAKVVKKLGEDLSWENYDVDFVDVSVEDLIEANTVWLEILENASIKFLKNFENEDIIVPISGGKDSTAALILAKKAFGDVKALWIRTNYDMPLIEEYIDYLEKTLKIEIIEEKVYFDVEKYGLPTFGNRWCTAKKLEVFEKYKRGILVAGDREAESKVRRMRPPVYNNEVFPVKYWSAANVQLYILSQGLKLHPLYYHGFYRFGCTICPSLSEWEKRILKKLEDL